MNVEQSVTEEPKRTALVLEPKNHRETINQIGKIQTMITERKGGTAPYPTLIAVDAINYLHTGMSRGVMFGEPFQPHDSPEVEIARAVDYYRKGCERGVYFE